MMVLQVEVFQASEYWISFIIILASLILAIAGTILDTMRNRELFWGFFFLFSAIFILFISIWRFNVYWEHSYILLFQSWEYISLIYAIIITLVAFRAMFTSFYNLDKKPVNSYIKVIVLASVVYYVYNIYLTIDILLRW